MMFLLDRYVPTCRILQESSSLAYTQDEFYSGA